MNIRFLRKFLAPVVRYLTVLFLVAPGFLPGGVAAQQVNNEGGSRQPSVVFEPRVSLKHTATTNAQRRADGVSDQITEIIPGFRWVSDGPRVKGFVDYSLHAAHYANDTNADRVWHDLKASAVVEAIEKWAFVDVSGVVSLRPISAFGAPVDGLPSSNASQTSIFRISPYVRGQFGSVGEYLARYSAIDTRTDASNRSDVLVQDWLLHVGNKEHLVRWSADATHQTADYSLGRQIESSLLRGRVGYAFTPQLVVTGIGGIEASNQISPTRETYSLSGFGVAWQPSARTRIVFERENRYFGSAHDLHMEHRSGRTVFRYSDVKGLSAQGVESSSMGPLIDLLDGFYTQLEPDPIRRMQIVLAEIERLGLPQNAQVFPDFLKSSNTLRRVQQVSVALLGQRSTITLTASRSNNRALRGALDVGDDFDTNSSIRQQGWSVLLAHRLTPNASTHAIFSEQRNVGSVPGLESRVRTFVLGWNMLLARHTNGAIQIRRALSDGPSNPYSESAIVGTITHRF